MDVEPRQAGFEAVAQGLIEPLRRYLARRTDPATADDVLSETLLVCWRRRAELPVEPLAWAYAVARNCLANAERARRRQDRLLVRIWQLARPPEQAPPEPPPAGSDPDPELAAALARLSAVDAELVRLWAWEELGPAEIALVVGLSPNAVSIRLHRARQKLRSMLPEHERAQAEVERP
ncbi:RNA polymerase sigma factor [Crossiella cryophila]|uniref:RNA polymerase sigma-70 factor (ECF subfamily) n=1 Tax=Crossiella cryophila TaxID=43355 RepID=A0A7W7CCG5_9PSEU|nr:sigma-70 family RNA polymerase sigma factor [Crossiella cryophila]MBB4678640.1 RNA polymerase sigma-70 factor (ECF subfamily) [Crossiella cryophila]